MINIELNAGSIIRFFVWVAILVMVYLVYDVFFSLFLAYIIMSSVNPLVDWLNKYGLPRWLAALLIFLIFFSLIGVVLAVSFQPLIQQTQNFIVVLPDVVQQMIEKFNLGGLLQGPYFTTYLREFLQSISKGITSAPGDILRLGAGIFGGFMDAIMVVIFAFYLILEKESIHRIIVTLVPAKNKESLREMVQKVESKLGSWLRGQVVLMIIIGVITYIGLELINMPFSFPLAVIAGLFEIVPIVGPIFASIPAILVGFASSPILGITVASLYVLIQQLENGIVVPRVMSKAVGLDPLIVIIALMIGGRLAGPMGMLLSVPVSAVLIIINREVGFFGNSKD